jgi:hypothetical protein
MSKGRVAYLLAILLVLAVRPSNSAAQSQAPESPFDCCAGLDAKIAALESSIVGRNVSFQSYGQINRALVLWDDGLHSKWSFVDNAASSTRLGLITQASISTGLVTGVRIEGEFIWPASYQNFDPADVTHSHKMTDADLRQGYWFVSEDRLGTLTAGHQWSATGDLTIINLGSQMNDAAPHFNNGYSLGLGIGRGIFSDLKWGQIVDTVDTLRANYVRYDTPVLSGFLFSASVGQGQPDTAEKDSWDVALRYQSDGPDFRFAGGIGYKDDFEGFLKELKGAASLLHHPTGLYISLAGGGRQDAFSSIIGHPLAHFEYAQAGLIWKWLPYGNTTAYGDFGFYKNYNVGALLNIDPGTGQLVTWGTLAETEVVRWGFGAEQAFDKSGLLVYVQSHNYQPTVIGFPCGSNPGQYANHCGGNPQDLVTLPMKPWDGIVAGARLRF